MKTRILPLSYLFLTFLTFFLTISAQAQVPSYVPTNGLVGYWPFNGNANDESGNGNNGTVNGPTLTADRFGEVGRAFSFDGNNDWIEVADNQILNPVSITVSAWLKPTNFNNMGASMAVNKGWDQSAGHYDLLLFSSNQKTRFVLGSDIYVETNSTMILNDWVFVTASISGLSAKIYVNGVLESSVLLSSNNSLGTSTAPLYFGKHDYNGAPYVFDGILDDISIYNRELTVDEVLALYNGCNIASLTVSGNVTPTQFTQETYTYPNTVGSTYNWTVTNGVIVSGQGTNSIDVMWANSGIGSVSVVETNGTNCSGDVVTYDVVIIPTDVEEFSAAIKLFPNPASNEINLQTATELIGSDLIIFDALGKQIHKQQILSTNTRINTSAFAAGNYVVKAGGVVKRFEVQK